MWILFQFNAFEFVCGFNSFMASNVPMHIPIRNIFIALPNGLLLLALRCPASRKIYPHALHTATPPASTHSHQHALMEAPFAHESLLCLTLCTPHACETRITRYVRPLCEQSSQTLRALVMKPGRPSVTSVRHLNGPDRNREEPTVCMYI